MSSRALCLIALLLTKCWCNYKKEALFLFLLTRVTVVSAQTDVVKSQNTHSSRALLPSNVLTVCLLWRLCFCALHVTLRHLQSPSVLSEKSIEVSWICASFCAGVLEIWWLFVYFNIWGVAAALGGLFIIPLTFWIILGIIMPGMNIHEPRI